jgi:hypothetical protein
MKNESIATPIYVAPVCLICDLHLKPYIEKVSIPPDYDQENCYRVLWLCEYCAFKYEGEM